MQAAWEHGLDISNEAVVDQVLRQCEIDISWAHEIASHSNTKNTLKIATRKIDNELFWGVDRIDSLRHYIKGNTIDESILQSVLSREPSALRKQ